MKKLISMCCGADVDWGVDAVNAYTISDGREMYCWICCRCFKPCKLKEIKGKR